MQKKGSKKKSANDYPMLAVRLKPEVKGYLDELLDSTLDLYNRDFAKDEVKYRKNEIFVKALEIGLKELNRRKKK